MFAKCSDFIAKKEWPQNFRDLSPLGYRIYETMLKCNLHQKRTKTWMSLAINMQRITSRLNCFVHADTARIYQNWWRNLWICCGLGYTVSGN